MARKKSNGRMTKQERALLHKKKMRRRIILLVVELILLAVLGAGAYAMSKLDKLDFQKIDEKNLEIYQDTGEFTNIALFGLDSREGELDGGVRSDCIMVASIDNNSKDVKIVSIFRDTLTQQSDGTYDKANAAYSYGGPEEAIALLNRNFDLDIKKYMSVNFNALADVIDLLGGIELDLTEEEVFWTNGYCTETSQVVGRSTTELTKPGKQNLDGIQAVSYARIRYTEGDDFKRSERQRIVLQQVVEKAKKAALPTLNKIVDQVLPQVSTNLSTSDFLGIAASAAKYKIAEMKGYPFDVTTSEDVVGLEGSYVVPIGFADNVRQLHEFLFGAADYQVSDKVKSIDNDIVYMTGIAGSDYETSDDSGTDDTSGTDDSGYMNSGYSDDTGYTDDSGYSDNSGYTDDSGYSDDGGY
ncbi:MAG: LCP family protein [Faecalicatena sp.]|uniref:LCP family protein n=1 Tax=Faecalicatena sp. TaxID=2005360 RepID=UPI0025907F8F|nr:LCP family protein [Faecalicatena sp.]MCI6465896.1 LCP family protein [Faecalicatena sp.]MDY5618688.1 LCP family protein [Lachnospiraceae bacterium]